MTFVNCLVKRNETQKLIRQQIRLTLFRVEYWLHSRLVAGRRDVRRVRHDVLHRRDVRALGRLLPGLEALEYAERAHDFRSAVELGLG